MLSVVGNTVSNMMLIQISSKIEPNSFDSHSCRVFLFFCFSVESFKFLQYIFACLCDGVFRQEVKVKIA